MRIKTKNNNKSEDLETLPTETALDQATARSSLKKKKEKKEKERDCSQS